MNPVEIEEAISQLAEQSFDAASFPYAFLEAFGNKSTTIKRLQSGSTNTSDIEGGVLQRSNIHIAVCAEEDVTSALTALKASPATTKAKAKFILATDGITLEAEDITTGETIACDYKDFPNHFGFFLPLAGITTVKQIRDNTFDIRATSRLNRLYVELLRHNPDWGTSEGRHHMNHFMARLIFCFFAEDTDIFSVNNLFTSTIEQMSATDSSTTHEVMGEIFRAMNTDDPDRKSVGIRSWADRFPYVNGGLFSGSTEVPRFTKIARSYLLHVGALDWKQINPDIFGSMIQAVADDDERGALGMHYTSVPNILKVLNPLFLDGLREQLEQAGDNARKLLNLRKRISNIRVFDPACGVLDPNKKTIIHIPNVNSRESTKDKIKEVEHIIEELGEWLGTDANTGFHLVKMANGKVIKIADLVDDDARKRDRVSAALKLPEAKFNRDHVDIIIALGMAKEGFDWVWCEHALTVGYRSSLTEIIQIIGRATRDAEGKTSACFTNLIAEPDASEEAVTDAVNDTLKAIAASLLMEQVLAPKFNFTAKNNQAGPVEGFDYGENGYDNKGNNIGFNESTGQFQIEIKGLAKPKTKDAQRICHEDLNEVITAFLQDKTALERGLFDEEMIPEELTQVRMGKIVKDKYPDLEDEDHEAIRQHAIAAMNLTQKAKEVMSQMDDVKRGGSTAFVDGIRKFAMDVRDLDIDLIDRINPFSEAYAIMAKSMSEESLKQIAAVIAAKKVSLTEEEARELVDRAIKFKKEHGRLPELNSADPWEQRMAEGVAFLSRKVAEESNKGK